MLSVSLATLSSTLRKVASTSAVVASDGEVQECSISSTAFAIRPEHLACASASRHGANLLHGASLAPPASPACGRPGRQTHVVGGWVGGWVGGCAGGVWQYSATGGGRVRRRRLRRRRQCTCSATSLALACSMKRGGQGAHLCLRRNALAASGSRSGEQRSPAPLHASRRWHIHHLPANASRRPTCSLEAAPRRHLRRALRLAWPVVLAVWGAGLLGARRRAAGSAGQRGG